VRPPPGQSERKILNGRDINQNLARFDWMRADQAGGRLVRGPADETKYRRAIYFYYYDCFRGTSSSAAGRTASWLARSLGPAADGERARAQSFLLVRPLPTEACPPAPPSSERASRRQASRTARPPPASQARRRRVCLDGAQSATNRFCAHRVELARLSRRGTT
jgi:hypothetical protein